MTRREWLERVFGVAVAATLAPLVDLTDASAAFWNQPALAKLWRITFPSGVVFKFNATVLAEKLLEDGIVQLTISPTGPINISQEISYPMRYLGELNDDRKAKLIPSPHAPATTISMGGGQVVQLHDILLPEFEEAVFGKQLRKVTFNVKFEKAKNA